MIGKFAPRLFVAFLIISILIAISASLVKANSAVALNEVAGAGAQGSYAFVKIVANFTVYTNGEATTHYNVSVLNGALYYYVPPYLLVNAEGQVVGFLELTKYILTDPYTKGQTYGNLDFLMAYLGNGEYYYYANITTVLYDYCQGYFSGPAYSYSTILTNPVYVYIFSVPIIPPDTCQ